MPAKSSPFLLVPVDQMRKLAAQGLGYRLIARKLGFNESAVFKAMAHHSIKTDHTKGTRKAGYRMSDTPPPVPDSEHERWLRDIRESEKRRELWMPQEANC